MNTLECNTSSDHMLYLRNIEPISFVCGEFAENAKLLFTKIHFTHIPVYFRINLCIF
jgi:hypothetical protein